MSSLTNKPPPNLWPLRQQSTERRRYFVGIVLEGFTSHVTNSRDYFESLSKTEGSMRKKSERIETLMHFTAETQATGFFLQEIDSSRVVPAQETFHPS